ncbi:MAG: hypothetical protein M1820_010885 [Bogoriella megaspora]|nr:MAG: hypothetical protein M1820_010885 [Bogoriella megaspora]
MADTEVLADRKPRKSVAFSEDTTIVDGNGEVTEMNGNGSAKTGEGNSAESHAKPGDKDADDIDAMMQDLSLKKKKKPKKKEGEEKPIEKDGEKVEADGEDLDLSAIKKKKKSKKSKPEVDDFEAKLQEAGVAEEDEKNEAVEEVDTVQDGDMDKGTGIWQHSNVTPIQYQALLHRFFGQLHSYHPDLASGISKSYKIPPPQCLREGNKKTIFANLAEICKRMKRTDEHVISFLFAELGTNGSVDGSRRLVIKGRFQQKQIENVLRRYIVEYVTCKTCRSPDTELSKGENRLWYVTCNSCGSRRSVTAIKTGFSAQVGKRKRQQG